jgi:hypothetical protein
MAGTSTRRSWHWFINVIAFVSFMCIGIVLFLNIFDIGGGIFGTIAYGLAFFVVGACSLSFVMSRFRGRRGLVWLIIWIVTAVLVTIAFIIPMFN